MESEKGQSKCEQSLQKQQIRHTEADQGFSEFFLFGLELSLKGMNGRTKYGIPKSTGNGLLKKAETVLSLYSLVETVFP